MGRIVPPGRSPPKIEGRESKLPDAEREQAWAEVEQQLRRFEGPNGCELPGEVLIGVGTK